MAVSGIEPVLPGANLMYRVQEPVKAESLVDCAHAFSVCVVSTLYDAVAKVTKFGAFVKVTAEFVLLVTSAVSVVEDPTLVFGKLRLAGDAATVPAGALPSKMTVCVVFGYALSVIVSSACRLVPV